MIEVSGGHVFRNTDLFEYAFSVGVNLEHLCVETYIEDPRMRCVACEEHSVGGRIEVYLPEFGFAECTKMLPFPTSN